MEEKQWSKLSKFFQGVRYEHLLAGIGGGVASTVILHPLDLIKIRFAVDDGKQSSRPSYYKNLPKRTYYNTFFLGLRKAFVKIIRTDGVKGLYNGISPNVTGAGAAWGFYFLFYNAIKTEMQDGNANKQLSAGSHMASGAVAGVLTLTMTNPIWVVKTRLCLQHGDSHKTATKADSKTYRGMLDALVKIGRHEGMRGLYRGYVPGLFGVSHGAAQFMAYEELKNMYHNFYHQPITTKMGNSEYLAFAALSKFFAALLTYPYQVVRARLQDQELKYSGTLNCVKQTYGGEGVLGFYKGLAPNLLRVVPATMITFVVYENLRDYLITRTKESDSVTLEPAQVGAAEIKR